jgi:hypothetical protein
MRNCGAGVPVIVRAAPGADAWAHPLRCHSAMAASSESALFLTPSGITLLGFLAVDPV